MKLIDRDHPFYKPLWRRITLVCVLSAWSAFEVLVSKEPLWMAVAIALLLVCIWQFLITWPKPGQPPQ
jgi:hypothetical protein